LERDRIAAVPAIEESLTYWLVSKSSAVCGVIGLSVRAIKASGKKDYAVAMKRRIGEKPTPNKEPRDSTNPLCR